MTEPNSDESFWQRDPDSRRPTRLLPRRRLVLVVVLALAVVVAVVVLTGGGSSDDGGGGSARPRPATVREVMVYADPQCGCCTEWAAYMRKHGFTVQTELVEDMNEVKAVKGVPVDGESCHTAVVGDYVVEGHVPIEAIDRLLSERPDIDGITLPGMPGGSPGMGGDKAGPFDVMSIDDGALGPFMAV